MIDDVVKQCVERIASSDSARSQRHILLANDEQLEHFAQSGFVGEYAVRVVQGNERIREFFFPAGGVMEPARDNRYLYVVMSDDSSELPELMGMLQQWVKVYARPGVYRGIVMFNKEHYDQGLCAHRENLRPSELDLTKKIPAYTKHQLLSG